MSECFSHQLRLDRIRGGERIELVASDSERAALARHLGLESLDKMEAHAMIERTGGLVRATGRILASLTQSCVVTGDAIAGHVDEPFDLLFTPEPSAAEGDCEIELESGDCDTIFHDGLAIELGQAIADTLALSVESFPRSAGADAALKEAGIMTEAEASPFAALAALKKGRESAD